VVGGVSLLRRVLAGATIVSVASLIERLLRFVTAPILTAALGPVPYGVMALVNTLSAMGGSVASLGLDLSYSRHYWGEDDLDQASAERFCWRFAFLNATIVALSLTVVSWFIFPQATRSVALLCLGVGVASILTVLQTMATTRRRLEGRYARIAKGMVLAAGCSATLSVALVFLGRQDVWVLLWAALLNPAMLLCILGLPGVSQMRTPSGLKPHQKWRLIRLGLSSAFTAPVYLLISSSDRWFLQHYYDSAVVGVYSFAYSIGTVGILFSSALSLAWFPESLRLHAKVGSESVAPIGSALSKVITCLIAVWLTIASLGGDLLRLVSHTYFHQGAAYIPWIAGGAFFYGVASLSTIGLIVKEDMMPTVKFWLGAAMVNLVGNWFLVPKLEGLGAAIVMCATYTFAATAVFYAAQKRLPLPISWRRLVKLAALSVGFVLLSHKQWHAYPHISLTYKLPAVVTLVLILTWQIAPEYFRGLYRMARDTLLSTVRNR
jgi:O-antigen/teichoic acid export membrane protein